MALHAVSIVALAAAMGACSSDLSLNNVTLPGKPETMMRKPDWTTFSGSRSDFELRPITAADLVGPEGQCGPGPEQGFADPAVEGSQPAPPSGGIVLQMTECDVVRRAGPAEKIDFGVNDRGERAVVLTYSAGSTPGIYRFVGGRLVSIERAPEPPVPPKAQKKAPPAKSTSGKSTGSNR
jgi:hypothetical protein